MTTVQTRLQEIYEREGFNVEVLKDGKVLKLRRNGVMGSYGEKKKTKDAMTVSRWKSEKFSAWYPALICRVLNGDGTIATGQKKLSTVRDTYSAE